MAAPVTTKKTSQVIFNEPVDIEIDPPKMETLPVSNVLNLPIATRPNLDNHEALQFYLHKMRDERGIDEGAVVVKRNISILERKQVRNWGVVMNVKRYQEHRVANPYIPLTIKWILTDTLSHMWPEDLLTVHKAHNWTALDDVFKAQL